VIHPTAIIHATACLDPSVEVGPYAVIDEQVVVGPGCRIGPHVHLTGHMWMGAGNEVHTGCVIGDVPQDLRFKDQCTRVRIGDRNVFREHVTVHRSNSVVEDTVIGSDNFLMAHCHIGHNVQLGNHVIIANGALLAGHSSVGDRAFISGNCLVHQFVRVGTVALMQGGSAVSKDLPPFTMARGDNRICGLNTVGLRRAGISNGERLELRKLYHILFRSEGKLHRALEKASERFSGAQARVLIDFVASAKRGVCADVSKTRRAALQDNSLADST
jgi:UDP-N-acetylglucosamine acyltransferase